MNTGLAPPRQRGRRRGILGRATSNTGANLPSSSGSSPRRSGAFDEAPFARSAAAFDNPDHGSIVLNNYRWRLGLAEGEPQYDALEQRLAQGPVIAVPTITLEGDANGVPPPDASAYAKQFSGKYAYWVITGGIGHNLPQEAP